MRFSGVQTKLPSLANIFFAVVSAVLLTLAFPNFDLWFLAWFALVPLFYAIEREKQSTIKSFVLGWIFGVWFFFATCWWLTFAPITYGGVPTVIAYLLFFGVTLIAGLFPAIFCAVFSLLLRRFGSYAILSAPFLWAAAEFLRFNLTGNNWNAIGYSQAFLPNKEGAIYWASVGGVYLVGFLTVINNVVITLVFRLYKYFKGKSFKQISNIYPTEKQRGLFALAFLAYIFISIFANFLLPYSRKSEPFLGDTAAYIVAVQPNVPMSGLKYGELESLRDRHIQLAEQGINNISAKIVEKNIEIYKDFDLDDAKVISSKKPKIIIFPESPMDFEYESDRDLQKFLRDFAVKNNASVLFNSAQPNTKGTNLFNSAVMINARGAKIGQYDKIHLVPFGETVPLPDALATFVPTMVGSFESGTNYNLFPIGDAKGGVMICFESHFPSLAREFVKGGADVLIEMTNDGYLGNTPILRQHLANAVFRAVETNRPVLRVTNVGITAYINERGEVLDAAQPYTEQTRVWTVSKSDGSQTFYVRYGDWFAWLCSIVSLALLSICFWKRKFQL